MSIPAEPITAPAGPRELSRRHDPRELVEVALSRWGVLAALSVLAAASLALRVRGLSVHYWVDEGLSVGIAGHPLSEIPHLLRQDGSPPLYYVLLHFWMSAFGKGEVATHEFSLVCALLAIPVSYWAGSSLASKRAGLICAVIAAFVPYLTEYGQETRMYSMLALEAIVVATSFVHAFVRRDRRYLPAFTVALAAAMYTHNWALYLAALCGVAFLFCVWQARERRPLWKDGLLAFGGVALMYAPWLPTVAYQASHTGAPWALKPDLWGMTQGLYFIVGGRGAAVAVGTAAGVGLVAIWEAEKRDKQLLPALMTLAIIALGTLLLAWAYAKVTPSWANRYLAVIVGPLLVLFGIAISRAGRLGLVLFALAVSYWVLDPVNYKLWSKSNVAEVAARIHHDITPGSLVLSTQPEQVPTLSYYLPDVHSFGAPLSSSPVRDPHIVDWRMALGRFRHATVPRTLDPLLSRLQPGARVVLVTPLNLPKQPLWMALIHRSSNRWESALEHDNGLRLIGSTNANQQGSGLAVRATVFAVR
jgi:uncharacterized membrane protein